MGFNIHSSGQIFYFILLNEREPWRFLENPSDDPRNLDFSMQGQNPDIQKVLLKIMNREFVNKRLTSTIRGIQ